MKLIPLFDRLLLKPVLGEKMRGGIIIPEASIEKTNKAHIHTLGVGENINAIILSSNLKVGDLVLYNKYAGEPYNLDGEDYLLVEINDLTAKLEE